MANVNGMGTVFNLPNFAGQLYCASPIVTPFLNLIRGAAVKPFRDVDGVGRCRLDPQKGADAVSYTINDFHLLFLLF